MKREKTLAQLLAEFDRIISRIENEVAQHADLDEVPSLYKLIKTEIEKLEKIKAAHSWCGFEERMGQ